MAADRVSEDSYRDFLDNWLYTHAGDNRGFGPEHDLAQANIVAFFEEFGLTVTMEPVIYQSHTYYNVVGTKLGTVYPDQEYIIGAHYDSVDNPGADDNGSGTALVLEAARVLTQYDSEYTIRFIAFDREEQGLWGSEAYVDAHITDDILGMISTDMVAYNTGANSADIFARPASLPTQLSLAGAIFEYGDGLGYSLRGASGASDHAPFESAGFQACLLIEEWGNPFYHSSRDNVDEPDYIDYAFATRMARSIVGWLVDSANVQVLVADGDFDGDDDIDMGDYAGLQLCFGGDGVPYPDAIDCFRFDFDYDGDVDIDDAAELHARFTGPLFDDCNGNGYPDEDDIANGTSTDCNENAIPDECEPDCDGDGVPDECALDEGSPDCNENAIPDECELEGNDCNGNGVPDECDEPVVLYFDDFETDQGWTVSDIEIQNGSWGRMAPQETTLGAVVAQPGMDNPDGTGTLCFVTDGRSGGSVGDYDVDGGPTQLTSPTIDMDYDRVTLTYAYWFFNDDGDDALTVEISTDDGAQWNTLLTHDTGMSLWRVNSVRIDELFTPTLQTRIRFSVSDNPNNSITEALIDDVTITTPDCGP